MHAINLVVSDTELTAIKTGTVPAVVRDRVVAFAMSIKPSNAIEIVASAGALSLYLNGNRLGNARSYMAQDREFWQISLAPDYAKCIRRNTLARLIDAVQAHVTTTP